MKKISKETRVELIHALRCRYLNAKKTDKATILNEFTELTGFHRKHAIRILNKETTKNDGPTRHGNRVYDEAVKQAIIVIWEAADRICSKRLKVIIPRYLKSLEDHGHLQLDPDVKEKVLSISPASMDRLLGSIRESAGSKRKRKQSKKISKSIKIKTRKDWDDTVPGYLEIDFVVHGGGSMTGSYIHSLVATDVCSGWVEAVPLIAREQSLVVEGLKQIREQLPVPMLGIDSDNDGAFINETLTSFCEKEGIEFTRSRAYQKNDQAWIEQKNGAVIRKIIGHARFSGLAAGQTMAQLFQVVRLYVNYFQPSFKLAERKRIEGRIKKQYHAPATPADRLQDRHDVDEQIKLKLREMYHALDPLELLHKIRKDQSALAALSSANPNNVESQKSLSAFLSAFPDLWKSGEVRPTHKNDHTKEHWWRTREDPFKDSWSDALMWLQQEPDITAKNLLKNCKQSIRANIPTSS